MAPTDNQARIAAPNYTQIPNAIFDLMADKSAGLTEKELKVLLAIARKTFGWHKKRDKISLSQLEQMTSMSRPSIVAGLEAAINRGIVRRTPDVNDNRGGVFYELIVEDMDQSAQLTSKDFELVNNSNQLKNQTRTSKDFELELDKNLNTQKKEKEKKERGGETQAHAPAVQAYFDTYPNERLNADQIDQINATVIDMPKWLEVLRYWKASNYRAQSIPKMLDRYSSGTTVATDRPGGNRQQNVPRAAADLPLYRADPSKQQTPEERKATAERRKAIYEQSKAVGK
jgi:phage replication O-like protein O